MQRERILTYRLRGSRITDAQEAALQAHWQKYGLTNDVPLNLDEIFPTYKTRIMEVGFGMGEATAILAKDFPETAFLAVEVHRPGVGKLCARLEENGSENVRILQHDVIDVINNQLADDSLDGVHVFFPDPWQKKRHIKRRLLTPDFLKLIFPKIKKGGFIHVATDWVPYAEFALKSFAQVPEYQGGEVGRPIWRPVTRFEGQGLDKNHRVTDMHFTKI
ncbi:MAG: tRNA (guanosine(46)-N7)-methyltransferase TrmB [Candidatus Nanopelagicaceae bacterium]